MSGVASAPASSGNLGPGFDCVALALEMRCVVRAETADDWAVTEEGATTRPRDGDLVIRAVRTAADRPMHLTIDNAIPRSRGLGSSSAVTAAAACAAIRALGKECEAPRLFELVTELEGHADNAAAAVFGGLILTTANGRWRHLELAPALRILVAVPNYGLSTHRARAALPPAVRLGSAVRSLARVGFLVEGLRTGDAEALAAAGGDEIHELARRVLSPLTGELVAAAVDGGALHACWSGAGPSVIAFCTDAAIGEVIAGLKQRLDGSGDVLQLEVAKTGVG